MRPSENVVQTAPGSETAVAMAAKIGSLGSGLSKNVRLLLDLAVLLPLLYITLTHRGARGSQQSSPVVVSTGPYGGKNNEFPVWLSQHSMLFC